MSSSSSNSSYASALDDFSDLEDQNDIEPIATEEEHNAYLQQLADEEEQERVFGLRFTGEVSLDSWCTCSHCSLSLSTKHSECFCCTEIPECQEKMDEVDLPEECITQHPGFESICLCKYNLEVAAIGLKTKKNKSYTTFYKENPHLASRFYRSVAYRNAVRFIWQCLGISVRTPLPSCVYNAIRGRFPSEDGIYKGFEDEEEGNEADGDENDLS